MGSAAFTAWDTWRRGMFPFNDWLKTPLALLAQMNAINMIYHTISYTNSKGSDWSKLSEMQMELVQWLTK